MTDTQTPRQEWVLILTEDVWCLGVSLSVSCSCLLPHPKAGKEKLGKARSVSETLRASCDKENWVNIHNMTLQFLTCCCYSSCRSCQHSRWQALKDFCASGKLLSFVGPAYVCVCGEGSGANFYLLIFKREKENKNYWHVINWSFILEERCMSVYSVRFPCNSIFPCKSELWVFLNRSAIKKRNNIVIMALTVT